MAEENTKRIRYKIVSGESRGEVEEQVDSMIDQGWALLGGVAVSNWCYRDLDNEVQVDTEYCQAMTIEEFLHQTADMIAGL